MLSEKLKGRLADAKADYMNTPKMHIHIKQLANCPPDSILALRVGNVRHHVQLCSGHYDKAVEGVTVLPFPAHQHAGILNIEIFQKLGEINVPIYKLKAFQKQDKVAETLAKDAQYELSMQ